MMKIAVLAGLVLLAGCGGGSSAAPIPTTAHALTPLSVSPSSVNLSLSAGPETASIDVGTPNGWTESASCSPQNPGEMVLASGANITGVGSVYIVGVHAGTCVLTISVPGMADATVSVHVSP